MFGQPVRLDVLGIAPIDRLGELTWLGPISVIIFGLFVGLVVQAATVAEFDRWMLLLTVGTFAGAYPLMYFAQEYVSLGPAVLISAGIVLTIIALRAATLMGVWLALAGVVLPAAAIMTVTLVATIWTRLQGILLTAEALGFFIAVMMLMPKTSGTWTPRRKSWSEAITSTQVAGAPWPRKPTNGTRRGFIFGRGELGAGPKPPMQRESHGKPTGDLSDGANRTAPPSGRTFQHCPSNSRTARGPLARVSFHRIASWRLGVSLLLRWLSCSAPLLRTSSSVT